MKIYHNGRDITGKFSRETFINKITRKIQVMWYWAKISTGVVGMLAGAFVAGSVMTSTDVFSYEAKRPPVIVEKIVEVTKEAPVLDRIAQAESKKNQFCTEELAKSKVFSDCTKARIGMVLMKVNTSGSIDWGYYQINDYYWGAKARELGFDLMTLEGNKAMGEWLYANHGTEPWINSKKNW